MDRTAALRALIKAVEADAVNWYGWTDWEDALPDGLWEVARSAELGSLDAAKALHEALLPEHTRDVDATAPECGVRVSIWSPRGLITGVGDHQPSEARAWLLAILRAHLYEQENK